MPPNSLTVSPAFATKSSIIAPTEARTGNCSRIKRAETATGVGAEPSAHLLDDDERDRDEHHEEERAVGELGAGARVREDAAGVVAGVGRDQARPGDREQGRARASSLRWRGRTRPAAISVTTTPSADVRPSCARSDAGEVLQQRVDVGRSTLAQARRRLRQAEHRARSRLLHARRRRRPTPSRRRAPGRPAVRSDRRPRADARASGH